MDDVALMEQRHRIMAAIHSASTKPELKLRKALWRHGFRYRINYKRLPGSPDIALPKYHTVIFIHGCFWHGHKGCKRHTIPKTNTEFWTAKVTRNQERDQKVWRELEAMGWSVIVIWECELKKAVFDNTIANVIEQINRNGASYMATKCQRRKKREEYLAYRRDLKNREAMLREEIESI